MRKLRVLVLMHDDLVPPDSIAGLSDEEIADWRTEFDVCSALVDLGHDVTKLGVGDEVGPIRGAIDELQPHVAVNLLVEFHGAASYDQHVASYLELLRTNYTGCNPRGLTLARDKALSKEILTYHRVRVPEFQVFERGRIARAKRRLRFPLFVKSVNEEASLGISQASIVEREEDLAERVAFIHAEVGTAAIAEHFIDGREIYVGVIGNQRLTAFPPRELSIQNLADGEPLIATRRVKWDLRYQREAGVRTGTAELSPEARAELARLAKRAYRSLRLSGYARMDFRLDADGTPYLLEANPNADLTYGEDFAESAEAAGISYEELLQRLLKLGIAYRADWKQFEPSPR
jgi:D-alanine-D-alanine ligase